MGLRNGNNSKEAGAYSNSLLLISDTPQISVECLTFYITYDNLKTNGKGYLYGGNKTNANRDRVL